MLDRFGREIDYLRIAITDRCNFRCVYCMPEEGVPGFRHEEILRYEEILRIVRQAAALGIRHIRITGGEPLARKGCLELIRQIRAVPGIEEIAMTTNGALLAGHAAEAKQAGLTAVNISLDTTDPEVFSRITRGGDIRPVLQAVDEALAAGIRVKINAVPARELNGGSLTEVALLARDRPICVRFIELMPVGCGVTLTPIPTDEVIGLMAAAFGELAPDDSLHGHGPARYLKPAGFTGSLGFISALSHEFCDGCNRVRITPEGRLKLCLNHTAGLDLRKLLRSGCTDQELSEALRQTIEAKPRRHAFGEEINDREANRMNQIGG